MSLALPLTLSMKVPGGLIDQLWSLGTCGGDLISVVQRTWHSLPGIGHSPQCSSVHQQFLMFHELLITKLSMPGSLQTWIQGIVLIKAQVKHQGASSLTLWQTLTFKSCPVKVSGLMMTSAPQTEVEALRSELCPTLEKNLWANFIHQRLESPGSLSHPHATLSRSSGSYRS